MTAPLSAAAPREAAALNERRTWSVAGISAAAMAVEIAGGLRFGSVGLLAEGLHMSAHLGAMLLAALGYWLGRRGGGRVVQDAAALANALLLLALAALIAWESLQRLAHPAPIASAEALAVAVLGLGVNVVSAVLLSGGHAHGHEHHPHGSHADANGQAEDLNLRAVYLHVLGDAGVSVLVILGLAGGLAFGWRWTDGAAGLVGAALVGGLGLMLLRRAVGALTPTRSSRS